MIEKETTETILKSDFHIDTLNNNQALNVMINNHLRAFDAVKCSLNTIELAVIRIVSFLSKETKSKIIYVGAGTSARIAVQDGVELYPTFGWPSKSEIHYTGGKRH